MLSTGPVSGNLMNSELYEGGSDGRQTVCLHKERAMTVTPLSLKGVGWVGGADNHRHKPVSSFPPWESWLLLERKAQQKPIVGFYMVSKPTISCCFSAW